MKKKINLLTLFLGLLLTIYSLGSCINEDLVSQDHSSKSRIVLNLPDESIMSVYTRAVNENVVNEVLAVVIRDGVAKYEVVHLITQNATTVSFMLSKISPQSSEKLYVFCNTGITKVNATNEEELLKEITFHNGESSAHVMHGSDTIADAGTIAISLKRASAKVTLASVAGITVLNWKVCSVPTKGYVAKETGYPENTVFTDEVVPDDSGNAFLIPRIDNSTTADALTTVLVEVDGNGWYRLDFYSGDSYPDIAQRFTPLDIVSNTWYQFSVQSIVGNGYNTAEEALSNTGCNIIYNMIVTEHAISNGQYALLLDVGKIILYPVGGTGINSMQVLNLSALIPEQSINNITTYKVTIYNPSGQIKIKDGNTNNGILTCDLYEGKLLTTANSLRSITLLFDGADTKDSYLTVQLGNIIRQIPIHFLSSNCYLFDFSSGKNLYIPISQANLDGRVRINKDIKITPQILWSDQPNVSLDFDYIQDKQWIKISNAGTPFTGNVIIAAVEDGSTNILWSWHVWALDGHTIQFDANKGIYDFNPSDIQNYNGNQWMNRNLGAYSLSYGETSSRGLLYQWGRKDPFPGGTTNDFVAEPLLYTSTGSYKMSESHPIFGNSIVDVIPGVIGQNNNLEYSIAHPNQFIKGNFYQFGIGLETDIDWYTDDPNKRNNYLWISKENTKTPYNPCPIGWTLPDGGMGSPWLTLWPTDIGVTVTQNGITWKNGSYYPFTPVRYHEGRLDRFLASSNLSTSFWWGNSSGESNLATYMQVDKMIYAGSAFRSYAFSLRCVREK